MRILIEGYPYPYETVKDLVPIDNVWGKVEKNVLMPYVGYFYNPKLADCVFVLPKVLLDANDKVFGKYTPESIINFCEKGTFTDSETSKAKDEEQLIYTLSVWIYRAIVVFKNDANNDSSIVYEEKVTQVGRGKRKQSDTFLDIILALLQFNRDNQNFFMFILKNQHSGYNKINWTRTISKSQAVVQCGTHDGRQDVSYLNPINKKRTINFDEELLVIFFSILHHLHQQYGFPVSINVNFQLITGKQFDRYLQGVGIRKLRQIKYKYYSDKALLLWELCYAFFDQTRQIFVNTNKTEFLLVKNFNIVFEAIIDALIGDKPLPDGMDKQQRDGKIVDHLYTAKSLIENQGKTYYIGDSKYYKLSGDVGDTSIYKQYTYARNVIQWNLDIFNGNNDRVKTSEVKLRDEETEGYNVIPNFFISARLDELYRYNVDGIRESEKKTTRHKMCQFENRLYDRDTLLLFHYDVNFLYVLSMYGKNNRQEIEKWKVEVRDKFRLTIQQWLQEDFSFYAMQAHEGVNTKEYIHTHFKEVIGKMYSPYEDQSILSLALDNDKAMEEDNNRLLAELRKSFYVEPCHLGENPEPIITQAISNAKSIAYNPKKNGVLMVMMENYSNKSSKFLQNGKLAIGIKWTNDSMEIVQHIENIGFILFHHHSDNDQHLFSVQRCMMTRKEHLDGIYANIIKDIEMYIVVELGAELDAGQVKCSKKKSTHKTRYDAQYAPVEHLSPDES